MRPTAPDSVVALQLHRSFEQVVGVLGVLMSGTAYLPLDPEWPLERTKFMADDAACGQLVVQTLHTTSLHVTCKIWFAGAVQDVQCTIFNRAAPRKMWRCARFGSSTVGHCWGPVLSLGVSVLSTVQDMSQPRLIKTYLPLFFVATPPPFGMLAGPRPASRETLSP